MFDNSKYTQRFIEFQFLYFLIPHYFISLSDLDDFANLVVISHFFFISEERKKLQEGNISCL